MKKLIIILLVCFKSLLVIAQSDTVYRHLPVTREKQPLFIINSNIIGFGNINPKDVDSVKVFKNSTIPANLKNLDKYGVILVILKKNIVVEAKSFGEIKEWLGITGNVKFAVDGFFIDDESLLVSTQSISEINVIKNNNAAGQQKDTVINIWTLEPNARNGNAHFPAKGTDKPGTIYIR